MYRIYLLAVFIAFAAGPARSGEVYLRDGVTDGDTFYLADVALQDDDPVLQSWVSYSLTRSACQLQIGGKNPARATSFECEFLARQHLIETWREQRAESDTFNNEYLDDLLGVEQAGFLGEYVARFLRRNSWQLPTMLKMPEFDAWRRQHLRRHKPQTRLIGSWNYADKVRNSAQ
jgi:hypothetical protein